MHARHSLACATGVALLAFNAPALALKATIGDTEVTLGGYVKVDALASYFDSGDPGSNISRDFYVPGLTPVGDGNSVTRFDMHAKETRLFLSTRTEVGGFAIGTHIEADFIVNQGSGADERITNAYNPGLRRAFITVNNLLVGQDWSSFQNLVALPDTLDFVRFPSDSSPFIRQPLVRYTFGGLDVSLENPETTFTASGAGSATQGARVTTDQNRTPDLVARYRFTAGRSAFSVAGLVRELRSDGADGIDDGTVGWGLSVAGRVPAFGNDDIRFTLSGGDGIGRYVAINSINGAQVDANGELDTVELIAGYIAYRRVWSERWRSTLIVSALSADQDIALVGPGVTKRLRSAAVNLLYSPVPSLTFGGEVRHADRRVEDGRDGEMTRLQFSAQYNF